MLTTEQDAKEKWCPHVRGARIEPLESSGPRLIGGCNTDSIGGTRVPASCRCIASACMQWRWGRDLLARHTETQIVAKPELGPGMVGSADIEVVSIIRRGFCGIAGEPPLTDE